MEKFDLRTTGVTCESEYAYKTKSINDLSEEEFKSIQTKKENMLIAIQNALQPFLKDGSCVEGDIVVYFKISEGYVPTTLFLRSEGV